MEIIEVTGYTVEEKVQIGKRHLSLQSTFKETGLTREPKSNFQSPHLEAIVEQYTNESGVRGLDKRISQNHSKSGERNCTG